MAKLEAGAVAPAFTLPDQDGKPVKLSDFKGQQVIVYFYPGRRHPGCTKEACQFNDNLKTFEKAGVAVARHLPRRGGEAHEVPHQVQAQVPAPHRRGQEGDGEVRGVGREDDVRQEDRRHHPLHLPGRPERQDPAGSGHTSAPTGTRRRCSRRSPRPDSPGEHSAHCWCCGHHHVVRPPTVAVRSSAPSLGHRPPAWRSSMSSPMCDPPAAAELAQGRTQGLVQGAHLVVAERVPPLRVEAGPPQDLVGEEVADAGQAFLIHEACLEGGRSARPRRVDPRGRR